MTTETTAVQVTQVNGPASLSLKQVTDRVNLVHQIFEKVLKNGTHYGTVPGCGAKKVLLKPGADVLAMTFQLVPQYTLNRTELPDGHCEFSVTCSMYSTTGTLLGQGVGSASTMEKKYRYRKDEQGRKIENEDIADVYNTVLKIAKKRAHIDATLTVTGAADIFTQDMIQTDEEEPRAPITQPKAKPTPAPSEHQPSPDENAVEGTIEAVDISVDKKNKPPKWTKYGIKINGEYYGTFDHDMGKDAQELEGQTVRLTWKQDGKYKTATLLVPLANKAEDTPGNTDE